MNNGINAACAQMLPEFGATTGNLAKIEDFTRRAAAELVVFPELAISGYDFRDRNELTRLALDPGDSPEFERLRELVRETECNVVVGFPERAGELYYNSAALLEPSGRTTIYRKLHLFDRENELFAPGDAEPPVVDTTAGRIGLMICFDWVFPEAARLAALKGCQILAHPANLVLTYCQRAMFARSVENGIFTLTCNRVGSESRTGRTLTFTGSSQIISNRGKMLAQASTDREEVISARFNPADADDKMLTASNHILNDRRVEYYRRLTE